MMFLALGLKERDRKAAFEAFQDGIDSLDRLLESLGDLLQGWRIAALLPVAEQIDPSLVPEVFWRAIAARPPSGDPRRLIDYPSSSIAMLLARYDREVAATLFSPIAAQLETIKDPGTERSNEFLAQALIDPRRAAALIERVPVAKDLAPNPNWVRITVGEALAAPNENCWKRVWRSRSGLGGLLFDRDYW
jgi:hypothetical protein